MAVFAVSEARDTKNQISLVGSVIKGVLKPGMEAVRDGHLIIISAVRDQDDIEIDEAKRGEQVAIDVDVQADWLWLQGLSGQQLTFTEDKKETKIFLWQPETIS